MQRTANLKRHVILRKLANFIVLGFYMFVSKVHKILFLKFGKW